MSFARSRVMAIVNLTPDSFYDGGRWELLSDGLRQVEKLAAEGADILDLGAASSRPGAEQVPLGIGMGPFKGDHSGHSETIS